MAERDENTTSPTDRAFHRDVTRKQRRKLRARRGDDRPIMFWLGMMGIVGWSVTMPAVIGALVGAWIDRTWPSRVSWTLTLLIGGLAVGVTTAWYWVRREGQGDDDEDSNESERTR